MSPSRMISVKYQLVIQQDLRRMIIRSGGQYMTQRMPGQIPDNSFMCLLNSSYLLLCPINCMFDNKLQVIALSKHLNNTRDKRKKRFSQNFTIFPILRINYISLYSSIHFLLKSSPMHTSKKYPKGCAVVYIDRQKNTWLLCFIEECGHTHKKHHFGHKNQLNISTFLTTFEYRLCVFLLFCIFNMFIIKSKLNNNTC